MKKISFYIN